MQPQLGKLACGNKSKWRLPIAYHCTWQQMGGARGHRYSKWIQKLASQQYVTAPQALWCHWGGNRDRNIDSCSIKGKRKAKCKDQCVCGGQGGPLTCCWLLLWQYICLHAWTNTYAADARKRWNTAWSHYRPPKGQAVSGRPLRAGSALPNGP